MSAMGALSACERSDPPQAPQAGRILYERHCGACHGAEGKGDGPVAASLQTPPADLTRIAERNRGTFDESAVMTVIDGRRLLSAHGTREMPVWGAVFEDTLRDRDAPYPGVTGLMQTRALADYLRSIQVQ